MRKFATTSKKQLQNFRSEWSEFIFVVSLHPVAGKMKSRFEAEKFKLFLICKSQVVLGEKLRFF